MTPVFGLGNDHHDYGRGFYLTDDLALAKEWAVCRPEESSGWVHAFRLRDQGLSVLDFKEQGVLAWMAVGGYPISVDYAEFNAKYSERDRMARDKMDELIAGPRNPAVKVMSALV